MRQQAVDRYVDRLLGRRRPKPFAATEEELAVVRTAIDLAAARPHASEPSPAFIDRLRHELREHEQEQATTPTPQPAWRATPRRRLLAAGALTATGALAGAAADELFTQPDAGSGTSAEQSAPPGELIPVTGAWQPVARAADVPEGSVVTFDLGAVAGFVTRTHGRVQAVSGSCTHQGCRLDLESARDVLACPCHGATFSLAGENLTRPRQSGQPLPALPRLPVRELDGAIQIYAPAAGQSPRSTA
jgi:nitrite reductase/ring-hydroxylating ferredoxin subunit